MPLAFDSFPPRFVAPSGLVRRFTPWSKNLGGFKSDTFSGRETLLPDIIIFSHCRRDDLPDAGLRRVTGPGIPRLIVSAITFDALAAIIAALILYAR